MKLSPSLSLLSRLLSLFAIALLVACGNDSTEPDPAPPEPSADATVIESPATSADNRAVEAELDAMLSALEKGDSPLGETFTNLSKEHQQTLQTAMEKAVKDIDFGLLGTAIGANLGNLSNIEGASVKVLSAEEAKELGIDLDAIRQGAPGVSVQSKIISVGIAGTDSADSAQPAESPEDDGEALDPEPQQMEIIETQQVDDPAATQRIQELLEAGDSDALAGELTKLLQSGIDSASVQQLLGQ